MNAQVSRERKFYEAVNEALDLCLARDAAVYVMGLGVPDPKGIFGTTVGLAQKYGPDRVSDMPTSENGMTGICIGSALVGMRPIMIHQRFDFALLAMDQIVNQAAKWHYLFAGKARIPLTIRLIVGRGWGQGPQHCQSLHAWFAHIPGLKVVLPASPRDAKGLLIAAVRDDNPVIVVEHRWLHQTYGEVPADAYETPIGEAAIVREGRDVSLVAVSHMVLEALRAAEFLSAHGIEAEVLDLRSIAPLDRDAIEATVRRTGHLLVADIGWTGFGLSAEVITTVVERAHQALKAPPRRIALPDVPIPTTPALSKYCYPDAWDLARAAAEMLGHHDLQLPNRPADAKLDVPDPSFTGPF